MHVPNVFEVCPLSSRIGAQPYRSWVSTPGSPENQACGDDNRSKNPSVIAWFPWRTLLRARQFVQALANKALPYSEHLHALLNDSFSADQDSSASFLCTKQFQRPRTHEPLQDWLNHQFKHANQKLSEVFDRAHTGRVMACNATLPLTPWYRDATRARRTLCGPDPQLSRTSSNAHAESILGRILPSLYIWKSLWTMSRASSWRPWRKSSVRTLKPDTVLFSSNSLIGLILSTCHH